MLTRVYLASSRGRSGDVARPPRSAAHRRPALQAMSPRGDGGGHGLHRALGLHVQQLHGHGVGGVFRRGLSLRWGQR